jgi:hypothetical protein
MPVASFETLSFVNGFHLLECSQHTLRGTGPSTLAFLYPITSKFTVMSGEL